MHHRRWLADDGEAMRFLRTTAILILVGLPSGCALETASPRRPVIDVGPLQASVDTKKTIPLSPLLCGLVFVGGIVLVVVGTKKSS